MSMLLAEQMETFPVQPSPQVSCLDTGRCGWASHSPLLIVHLGIYFGSQE